jgi:hypothetical protein
MIFLIISFLFGLAGGVCGKVKGSSFFLWFLVSAIPPYIGVVAALLFRSEHDEPRRACPGCGKVVPLHDALCTRCGYELEFPAGPTPPAALAGP